MEVRNLLKSNTLTSEPCDRIKEASSVPFRSLQMGLDNDIASEDSSVQNLEMGLFLIEKFFNDLLPQHLPVRRSTNEPPRSWGPFAFSTFEPEKGDFNPKTFLAVKRFQEQAGLKSDGKARIKTLARLDEILVSLKKDVFLI